MFILGVFNVRFGVRERHDVYVSSMVFNMRFIKVLCISFRLNNKINMFGFFIKVIKRLEIIEC